MPYLKAKLAKILFVLRLTVHPGQWVRLWWLKLLGLTAGRGTRLGRRTAVNWPHQVSIGSNCSLQSHVSFDYCHGDWRPGPAIIIGDRCFIGHAVEFNVRVGVSIGSDSLIASGCKFIDHDHGIEKDRPINQQQGPEAAIVLEKDVWLGVNVVVLKGVIIGGGAVVAAGAVVTKSVPPMEIWAGIPARCIGLRR